MASLADVNALAGVFAKLNTVAVRELVSLMRFASVLPEPQRFGVVADGLTDILIPNAAKFEAVGAEFYLSDREQLGITSRPPRVPETELDVGRIKALAGFALAPLKGDSPDLSLALERLTGSSQRMLYDVERETVMMMGAEEDHAVSYQRMAQPGCCAFCAMLASRGAVYSEDTVTKVVGRGVPLGRDVEGNRIDGKSRGRTGKGIKARGARPIGEDYHDKCRCVGVAVHAGRVQQMDAAAERWYEIYRDAKDSALTQFEWGMEQWLVWGEGFVDAAGIARRERHLEKRYFWVDDRKDSSTYGDEVKYSEIQKKIVAEMRRIGAEKYDLVLK